MKKVILLVLWVCTTKVYCQEPPLAYVENFFRNFAPCGEPIYCYDYALEVERTDLVVTTKLYNYDGEPKRKVLTEETIYKIPVSKLKNIDYFPYDGQEIYFITFDADIQKHSNSNGETKFVDLFPLDFSKYQLNEERKKDLEKNLDALVRDIE